MVDVLQTACMEASLQLVQGWSTASVDVRWIGLVYTLQKLIVCSLHVRTVGRDIV
jgi:hypothetical protein